MNNDINIAGRLIGPQHPPYIIAEMSANHNGSLELAKQTISMAKACGADASKCKAIPPIPLPLIATTMSFRSKADCGMVIVSTSYIAGHKPRLSGTSRYLITQKRRRYLILLSF
jgi:Sialic acid synthase